MQVKKFEAPTMQEALKVIKQELGPDAVILSTKQNRAGFGLMSKTSVEVTAAVSEKDLKKKKMTEKNLPQDVKEKIWNKSAEKQAEIYDSYFEKQLKQASGEKVELRSAPKQKPALRQQPAPVTHSFGRQQQQFAKEQTAIFARPEAPSAPVRPSTSTRYADIVDDQSSAAPAYARKTESNERVKNLEHDIENLRTIIQEMSNAKQKSSEDEAEINGISEELHHAMQDLVSSGIEKKFARQIITKIAFDMSPQEKMNEQIIQDRLAMNFVEEIRVADLLQNVGAAAGKSSSTFVALVGPTGVGKTTTIAKIASLAILEKRLRVGLINLDSYKVAAADQLSTYARIMNVPFRSVASRDELMHAVYDFASLDLVLIDTTGRSQKDHESLMQLKNMLSGIEGLQTVLMLSATTRDSDMNDITKRFGLFSPLGMVFSKLDETTVYGSIYNAQKRTNLPLLYFTVGQRVPEDIERATSERFVDLIMDL